jgi:tRNA threonylcarbamoyladenosine biosynthesis protein TsaB
MNIIAIESASTICGVALFLNSQLMELDEINEPRIHSERLPVIVEGLLSKHSINVNELDGIAVSSGPGSYTGLRIGMSLAKGLAASGNTPIIPVPTLLVMNVQVSDSGYYWVGLHSHKDLVYTQRFHSGEPDSEVECKVLQSSELKPLYGFNLDSICNPSEYESTPPSAKTVGELALKYFDDWAVKNLNKVTPNYITTIKLEEVKTY